MCVNINFQAPNSLYSKFYSKSRLLLNEMSVLATHFRLILKTRFNSLSNNFFFFFFSFYLFVKQAIVVKVVQLVLVEEVRREGGREGERKRGMVGNIIEIKH